MEPSDLNSPASDDRLESLLRQPGAPLPDDGFAVRVLTALPPPAAARRTWPRLLCYLGGALAGGTWFATREVNWGAASASADQLATTALQLTDSPSTPAVVLAVSIAGLSLAVAFLPELRERLGV